MNLAQLIDPERVQSGEHRRDAKPRTPSPRLPMGTVFHVQDMSSGGPLGGEPHQPLAPGYAMAKVRQVLAAAGKPMSARDVFAAVDELEVGQVQGALGALFQTNEVERTGVRGDYRYTLMGAELRVIAEAPAPPVTLEASKRIAERKGAPKPAPSAQPKERRLGEFTIRVLKALAEWADAENGMGLAHVCGRLRCESAKQCNDVAARLAYFVKKGFATKSGTLGSYRYLITEAGCAKLR